MCISIAIVVTIMGLVAIAILIMGLRSLFDKDDKYLALWLIPIGLIFGWLTVMAFLEVMSLPTKTVEQVSIKEVTTVIDGNSNTNKTFIASCGDEKIETKTPIKEGDEIITYTKDNFIKLGRP